MPARKRDYKKEAKYHASPTQRKNRSSRNKARRKLAAAGKVRRGQDVDHADGNPRNNSMRNLRAMSPSKNRSKK
jgi:hypothetical protein